MSLSSSAELEPFEEETELRSVLPAPSPWFVAFCMVVIAGSLAALLYLRAGLSIAEAGWVGLAALLIMVLAEFYSARARERSAVEMELQEVVRISTGFRDEIVALGERVADIEATLTVRIDDMIEERVESIVADMRAIEERIEALSDPASAFEGVAAPGAPELRAGPATVPPAPVIPVPEVAAPDIADVAAAGDEEKAAAAEDRFEYNPAFPGMTDAQAAAVVRGAIEEHGPDVHLQSIVTLPQRRVRFYEALTRLRTGEGRILHPRQFLDLAGRSGLMPILDNAVLFRAVQILRKIMRKNNEVGIFCNISARSLSDGEFFRQFIDFLGENRGLAASIVFEFTQEAFDELGPIELANLDALGELGFRFSIDNVKRLDMDCAKLARHGVRYVKIDAETLMHPPLSASAHIHAVDFSALLARYGITLIATRVEAESQVVDLLDYDVKFAQGNLFSPPRMVRNEFAHTTQRAPAH